MDTEYRQSLINLCYELDELKESLMQLLVLHTVATKGGSNE